MRDLRKAYPVFLAGRLFGPNRAARARIAALQREVHAAIGRPSVSERLRSLLAAGLALWTAFTLRFGLFQHMHLVKHAWRVPAEARRPSRIWQELVDARNAVSVERRPDGAVWLRLHGALGVEDTARIARQAKEALRRTRDRLVLDLKGLKHLDSEAAEHLAESLREHRARIRILAPASLAHPGVAAALALQAREGSGAACRPGLLPRDPGRRSSRQRRRPAIGRALLPGSGRPLRPRLHREQVGEMQGGSEKAVDPLR